MTSFGRDSIHLQPFRKRSTKESRRRCSIIGSITEKSFRRFFPSSVVYAAKILCTKQLRKVSIAYVNGPGGGEVIGMRSILEQRQILLIRRRQMHIFLVPPPKPNVISPKMRVFPERQYFMSGPSCLTIKKGLQHICGSGI